jgi:hypothetical protein
MRLVGMPTATIPDQREPTDAEKQQFETPSAIWVRKSTDLSSRHRNWIYCHLEAPCGGELEIVRRSGRRWLSGPFKGVRESAPPERASSRTGCRRSPSTLASHGPHDDGVARVHAAKIAE